VIYDPALGKTRSERAFGESVDSKGIRKDKGRRAQEFLGTRNVEPNMYGGPRSSYSRYQVSEQASDILNRQIRSYNK